MNKIILLVIVSIAMFGCKHLRHELVIGPDGGEAISMRCGNMQMCYKAAGEFCPRGYEVMNQSTNVQGGVGLLGRETRTRGIMLIKCNSGESVDKNGETVEKTPN